MVFNSIDYEPFFVRRVVNNQVYYVDINIGIEYKEIDVPFDTAGHGLCEALGRPVYKLSFKRLVLAPVSSDYEERMAALIKLRPITVPLRVGGASKWTFERLAVYETLLGLNDGLDERELATRLGSPVEAIGNLLKVIERRGLMEKVLGGDENGGNPPERRTGDTERLGYDLRY